MLFHETLDDPWCDVSVGVPFQKLPSPPLQAGEYQPHLPDVSKDIMLRDGCAPLVHAQHRCVQAAIMGAAFPTDRCHNHGRDVLEPLPVDAREIGQFLVLSRSNK